MWSLCRPWVVLSLALALSIHNKQLRFHHITPTLIYKVFYLALALSINNKQASPRSRCRFIINNKVSMYMYSIEYLALTLSLDNKQTLQVSRTTVAPGFWKNKFFLGGLTVFPWEGSRALTHHTERSFFWEGCIWKGTSYTSDVSCRWEASMSWIFRPLPSLN
jgi:hypothetical protein